MNYYHKNIHQSDAKFVQSLIICPSPNRAIYKSMLLVSSAERHFKNDRVSVDYDISDDYNIIIELFKNCT